MSIIELKKLWLYIIVLRCYKFGLIRRFWNTYGILSQGSWCLCLTQDLQREYDNWLVLSSTWSRQRFLQEFACIKSMLQWFSSCACSVVSVLCVCIERTHAHASSPEKNSQHFFVVQAQTKQYCDQGWAPRLRWFACPRTKSVGARSGHYLIDDTGASTT